MKPDAPQPLATADELFDNAMTDYAERAGPDADETQMRAAALGFAALTRALTGTWPVEFADLDETDEPEPEPAPGPRS